jgi:DNA-binding CsgD family transcriptional regulator
MAAADGDLAAAERLLSRAVGDASADAGPYERARTLLVLGSAQRRSGTKKAAIGTLDEAVGLFEAIDADPWASLARKERARIGGRRSSKDRLTDAERRVAKLAAAGRTNKQIAVTLSLAVRTVEGHLASAYRKLGIHNRTELAIFLDDE